MPVDNFQLTSDPLERARRNYGAESNADYEARIKRERKERLAAERAQVKMPFVKETTFGPTGATFTTAIDGDKIFPFGKWKANQTIARMVPIAYLQWFVDKVPSSPWRGPVREFLAARLEAENSVSHAKQK